MKRAGAVIIGVAIIWGATMIACALTLRGTEYKDQILMYLGGGAAASLLVTSSLSKRESKE